MNEGHDLLLNIANKKLLNIHSLNKDDLVIDNVNLVDLLVSIEEDVYNFSFVTDTIIDRVVSNLKIKDEISFKKSITQIRDLLVGRRDYNLKINLNSEYLKQISIFVDGLISLLDLQAPGITKKEKHEKSCTDLINAIKSKEIISDFAFIENIVREYNEIEFDNNMVSIMRFINEHNLHILKTPKKKAPLFDIHHIRRPKLDSKIQEILDKLEINYKELPNYLIRELKNCDYEEVYKTYNLAKKNKAEDYGILHLIKKENVVAKIILLLYATPESIKNVVDSVKNQKGKVEVNILRVIVNSILPCFLVKNNEYFKPKYDNFIKNIMLLKDLGVNYKALICRNPLFMTMSNEDLNKTLSILEINGADKKSIVNKCYKILSINPNILIDNTILLIKYNVNMKEFFKDATTNYSLIKVVNLESKLEYIIKKHKLNDNLNLDLISKLLTSKIYQDVLNGTVTWGEDND